MNLRDALLISLADETGTNELKLPWKVVRNHIGRIAIVDCTNNGKDFTSGRVCNIPQGKNGQGLRNAREICRRMNTQETR